MLSNKLEQGHVVSQLKLVHVLGRFQQGMSLNQVLCYRIANIVAFCSLSKVGVVFTFL